MPRFTPRRFEQIFLPMLSKVVARTNLSDVVDTSVIKHILAAAARQDDEQYFQMTLLLDLFSIDRAQGDDLDERAKDIQPAIITRGLAVKADGHVVFSRTGTSGTVTVPAGSKVKTADAKMFTTQAAATITPSSVEQIAGHGTGRDSNVVAVQADVAAAAGNVAANTIIKFDAKPAGVDQVTNPNPLLHGLDKETDDSFRSRLKQYIASLSRCTVMAIEQNVLGLTDPVSGSSVLFAHVVEDYLARGNFTVYVDDGTGTAESSDTVVGEVVTQGLAGPPANSAVGGEQYLLLENRPIKDAVMPYLSSSVRGPLIYGVDYTLNPASGQLRFVPALVHAEVITANYTYYTGLIQFVQRIVDGDASDRTGYPGLRAAGTLAVVRTPQILVQTVVINLVVLEGYVASDVRAAVKDTIKRYINGLGISGDVVRNEIIRRTMEVAGVYDATLVTPSANHTVLDNQLIRTTDGNITVT